MAVPSKVVQVTNIGVGPHALTQRWTYTVPAGRFCIVELLHLFYTRAAASGAPAAAFIRLTYTPSGGAASIFYTLAFNNGVLDVHDHIDWGSELRMKSGDTMTCETIDTSVGGTISFVGSLIGTEYDN